MRYYLAFLIASLFVLNVSSMDIKQSEGTVVISSGGGGAIDDGAVTTPKLAADAVTEPKIINGAVTSPKIGDGEVTTPKLGTDAVTNPKIINSAVTTPKLAADAVTNPKIINDAVTTPKLAADAVTTPKIINDAVTTPKLAADAVTTPKIINDAITTQKIAADAVTRNKIASDGCTLNQILKVDGGGNWNCAADSGAEIGLEVEIASFTYSADSEAVFEGIFSSSVQYVARFNLDQVTSGGSLIIQFNGVAANDYNWAVKDNCANGDEVQTTTLNTDSIRLTGANLTPVGETIIGRVTFETQLTSFRLTARSEVVQDLAATNLCEVGGGGTAGNNGAELTKFRLYTSAGTMTGIVRIYERLQN